MHTIQDQTICFSATYLKKKNINYQRPGGQNLRFNDCTRKHKPIPSEGIGPKATQQWRATQRLETNGKLAKTQSKP